MSSSVAAAVCVFIVSILANLALAGVAAARLDLWRTDYTRYPACFRQPVLLRLSSVDLIALAEGRNNTYCSGLSDGAPSSIHVRTSSDAGVSWTDDQVPAFILSSSRRCLPFLFLQIQF
jgi:hypothetical protein